MAEIKLDDSSLIILIDDSDLPFFNSKKWHYSRTGINAYVQSSKVEYLHRLLMNAPKDRKLVVDHINGNGLDNRRCNLQIITQSENIKKRKKYLKISSNHGRYVPMKQRFASLISKS